jgi:hypothetical protein
MSITQKVTLARTAVPAYGLRPILEAVGFPERPGIITNAGGGPMRRSTGICAAPWRPSLESIPSTAIAA